MAVSVNTSTNTINVQQDNTRIIQVSTPGPQGQQGPVAEGGIENYVAVWSDANNLRTGSIYSSGSFTAIRHFEGPENPSQPDILYVNGDGVNTYNMISAHGNQNGYIQINVQNYNAGGYASSDIVTTADNGNENSYYIDMGINSSGYNNPSLVGTAGDAYLYSTGNDLYIGNASANKRVIIFNGDLNAIATAKLFVHENGTIGVNTDYYDPIYPSSLWIEAPNQETYNLVVAKSNVNNYSQLSLTNQSSGSLASADIVAQNDLGTETDYYVDMGINSSGHSIDPGYTVGGPNDTYLLSVAGDHYIGSSKTGSIIIFTGPDFNGEANAKLILNANNQHQISGSLNISGSINLNNILTLTPQHPLPLGIATGSFAVSSSVPPKPYFFDGTSWNALY